jgi:hypothetical protein
MYQTQERTSFDKAPAIGGKWSRDSQVRMAYYSETRDDTDYLSDPDEEVRTMFTDDNYDEDEDELLAVDVGMINRDYDEDFDYSDW